MSVRIESEIRALLNDYIECSVAGEQLLRKYLRERHSTDDSRSICNFFYNAGLYKELIEYTLQVLIPRGLTIPWELLIEATYSAGIEFDDQLWMAIEKGAEEQNLTMNLALSPFARKTNSKVKKVLKIRINDLHQKVLKKKMQLLEELEQLRSQNLLEAEKAHLQKMLSTFPGDIEILRDIDEQKDRNAREVFNRYRQKYLPTEPSPLTYDEKSYLRDYIEKTKPQWQKRLDTSYDVAVAMFMFDDYEQCLSILERLPSLSNRDWLKAECLLKLKRYVELLNILPELELKYANDPETIFSATYLRAQCLYGLGQKQTALDLMEVLILQRPDYRAATSLLSEWRNI